VPQINIPGRVSVIVFFYNMKMHVEETLQSLIDQTYDDMEVVLVDDGSTDDTMEIASRVMEDSGRRWSRCRTSGPSAYGPMTIDYPIWAGVAHSTGEFISFLAADDLTYPHKFSRLVDGIGDSPMIYCNSSTFLDFDAGTIRNTYSHTGGEINASLSTYCRTHGTESRCRLATESILMRKDIFMRMRNYVPFEIGGWDGESGLMLAAYALGNILHLNEVHSHQRVFTPEYLRKYGNLLLEPGEGMRRKMAARGYEMDDIVNGKYKYLIRRLDTFLEMGRDRIERET